MTPTAARELAAHGARVLLGETYAYRDQLRLRRFRSSGSMEVAVFVDADTGALLGSAQDSDDVLFAYGEVPNSVNVGPLLRAAGDRVASCVAVHTHPEHFPVSRADAREMIRHRLRAVVAITDNGDWYVVSVVPDAAWPSPDAVRDAFEADEARDVAVEAFSRARSVGSGKRRAEAEVIHAVWLHVAAHLGLRYTRVDG